MVIVHIANVPSFQRRTVHCGPDDWKNLNRVFPGNASGTPTERIAHVLTHEVFDRVDAVVDVHCGDGNEALSPYVAFIANAPDPSVTARSRAMAMAALGARKTGERSAAKHRAPMTRARRHSPPPSRYSSNARTGDDRPSQSWKQTQSRRWAQASDRGTFR